MTKTIADLIYKTLLKNNVKDVFLYSGGSIMPLIDKFYNSGIKLGKVLIYRAI